MLSASVPELPVPELPVPECIHTNYARVRGLEAVKKHHPSCKGAVHTIAPGCIEKVALCLAVIVAPAARARFLGICKGAAADILEDADLEAASAVGGVGACHQQIL